MKDVSYLANKPIAVLGGGATGRAHACDCKLGNTKEVRLYEFPDYAESLGPILDTGILSVDGPQMNLYGFKRSGTAKVDLVTTDIKEAVAGAGIIIVSMPAVGFDKLNDLLIPCLEDGQFIHFLTGNFGSFLLRHKMKQAGSDKKVVIGDWTSQPFSARINNVAGVQLPGTTLAYRAITLKAAALPHSDSDAFIKSAKYIPSLEAIRHIVKGDTAFDISFSNVNPVLHVPGTILSVSTMENYGRIFGENKYDFSIYSHGFSTSIAEVQYAFYLEQKDIADAIGFEIEEYEKKQFHSRMSVLGKEFLGPHKEIPFDEQLNYAKGTGPFDINNRYITEDVPVGCSVQRALGKKFGVKTPIIDSMVTLSSVMTKINFNEESWDLDKLGIANMDKDELNRYVR